MATPKRKTLASVIGATAAAALFVAIPREESGREVAVTITPTGEATVTHVSGKQYLRAYLDSVGVATACDGITKGVRMGQTYTEAECTVLLEAELIHHAEGIMRCTPGLSDPRLTVQQQANLRTAAVLLGYNIGVAGWCNSTAARQINAGNIRAACAAFAPWNRGTFSRPQPGKDCIAKKSGGYLCVIDGLTNRRKREQAICLKAVK